MKKIACLVVSLALALSLCGCFSIITEPELEIENEKLRSRIPDIGIL